ncbi:MAG: AI-2E family transporter [Thermoguttaceae bacterium]|nr:AI-2E family transporter [Thermoguttaceae bacterium]
MTRSNNNRDAQSAADASLSLQPAVDAPFDASSIPPTDQRITVVRMDENPGHLLNYSAMLAAGVVILGGIHCARAILGPLFIAAFFAALLISPLRWLRSKGMSGAGALAIVILGVLFVGLVMITIVGAQLTQFAQNIPSYRDAFNEKLTSYNLDLGDFIPFLKEDKKPAQPEQGESDEVAYERFRERMKQEWREEASAREDAERAAKPVGVVSAAFYAPSDSPIDDDAPAFGQLETDAQLGSLTPKAQSSELLPAAEESKMLPSDADSNALAKDLAETDESAAQDEEGLASNNYPEIGAAPEEDADAAKDAEAEEFEWRSNENQVSAVNTSSSELFRFLGSLVGELSSLASNAFIIMLLIIFMLCESATMPKKLIAALGARQFTNTRIQNVVADIRKYMVIKTWMSIIVGVSVSVLLIVSKVQYPLLWGIVAFLLNYIPNIGSVVAAIPPIVLATVEHGMVVGGVDAVFFVLINCCVGYGLEPRLLGNGLDLSPLIVLIALILFGWLLGPIGMFLSPALAVILKIIFQSFPETQWIASLMADRPPKDENDAKEIESA